MHIIKSDIQLCINREEKTHGAIVVEIRRYVQLFLLISSMFRPMTINFLENLNS